MTIGTLTLKAKSQIPEQQTKISFKKIATNNEVELVQEEEQYVELTIGNIEDQETTVSIDGSETENSSQLENNTDESTAPGIIPQAGNQQFKIILTIAIITIIFMAILYKKYKNMDK